MRIITFVAALCAIAITPARASDLSFEGYARSLDSGELLYLETHAITDAGGPGEKRVVLYRCPTDSSPFARKLLEYGTARTAPAFDFNDARSGFAEGLKRDALGLTVFARAGPRAPMRARPLVSPGQIVADAGFDEFVRQRWESLERGKVSKVSFVVPSLEDTVAFRVRKVDETNIDGDIASVMRLSLAGPLGWFLPDIEVSYRQRDRRLLRYRGTTNIRDAAGVLLEAQIDFPDAARNEAAVDLTALRSLPLATSCGGS